MANDGPSVIRFKARLVRRPNGTKSGSSMLLAIPTTVSNKISGMVKLEGTINGHPFRAPLEPETSNGRRLRVNKAMLDGARAGVGDSVQVAILGPEPEPSVPADLRKALTSSLQAKTLWKHLDSDGRRIWIRWIDSAKTSETRARRITRTVQQLAEGKRRPCCVNVYEFMLSRVQK